MPEHTPDTTNKEQLSTQGLEGTLDKLGLGILKPALNLFGIGAILQSFGNGMAASPIFSWLGKLTGGEQIPPKERKENVPSSTLLAQAAEVIKGFEGFHPKAYWDYQQYSVGYGTKATSGTETITQEKATQRLERHLREQYLPGVQKIPYWNDMSLKMQTALLSFAYNIGANFYGSSGTEGLSALLRNKEWNKVPAKLQEYAKAGGRTLPGLVARRAKEASMWEQGLREIST